MTDLMTCAQADTLLADWLDETLDASAAQAVGAHVRACSRCTAQLAALDAPDAEAARLPELVPSRDLWAGIEARIQTPVVELATRPAAGALVTPRRFGWVAQAAAAVALVTVSAGTTWLYAGRTINRVITSDVISGVRDGYHDADLERLSGRAAMRAVGAESALPGIERTYDAEIGALRGILQQRRNDFDPRTLAVLEKNLKVIDDAIAQSRQALQHDPANVGLGDQLAGTLDQKLQLLRTAALLPPRA